MLLGIYRPRLFLVTTPSYTYNARMRPPGIPLASGFPDPTGRTDRVFRHSDHKFEWTEEEFGKWCKEAATKFSYDVEIGGVGKALDPDPWGRDATLGFASQAACFRRRDSEESGTSGSNSLSNMPESILQNEGRQEHELLASHHHSAHPLAGKAASHEEILKVITDAMSFSSVPELEWTVHDLWVHGGIDELCGGYINCLLEVIDSSGDFHLETSTEKGIMDWKVTTTNDTTYGEGSAHDLMKTGLILVDAQERNMIAALTDMDVNDFEEKFQCSMAKENPDEFDSWTVATGSSWDNRWQDTLESGGWEETVTTWSASPLMTSSQEAVYEMDEPQIDQLTWTDTSTNRWSQDGEREDSKWRELSATPTTGWDDLVDNDHDYTTQSDATWSNRTSPGIIADTSGDDVGKLSVRAGVEMEAREW